MAEQLKLGHGAPMDYAELPAPPAWNWGNILKIVGPGAIVLSLSIGSGEFLMGPAATIQYGTALMWIVTIGCLTQTFFNMECIRYTLYTGEPAMVGITRLWPGPKFWGPVWVIMSFLSVTSGWVLASATAVAGMILQRMPDKADRATVVLIAFILLAIVIFILSVGGKIEDMLEKFSKACVVIILLGLLYINFAYAPAAKWAELAGGFFKFGFIPKGADMFLLAGFAGYAAAGGIFNMVMSNHMRDKGYAMGSVVGYIPSIIGGKEVHVSHTGKVFKITPENLNRWKVWWRYASTDQWVLFFVGCLVGMYLCVLMSLALVPAGTKLGGWALAAFQAQGLAKLMGPIGWYFLLFIGFWVLFGTQLGCTDAFVRQVTDLIWQTGAGARGGDIRKVYYGLLIATTVWLGIMLAGFQPFFLLKFAAVMATGVFFLGGIQILILNHKLPKELRPMWYQTLGVLALIVFYGIWFLVGMSYQFFGVRF